MIKHLMNDEGYSVCILQHTDNCRSAHGFKKKSEFYSSRSEMFPNGVTPVCKDCVREFTMGDGELNKLRLLKILTLVDKPYKQEVFESAEESIKRGGNKGTLVSEYFRLIAMPQWIELTFSNSDSSLYDIEKQIRQEINPYDIPITNELKVS